MRRRRSWTSFRRGLIAASVVLPGLALAAPASAASGDLDPTFFGSGRVVHDVSLKRAHDWADDLAVQPDGKVLAVGFFEKSIGNRAFAIVRYRADGFPDLAFGGDGIVTINPSAGSDQLRSVQLQPDGRIVSGGWSQSPSGDLDFAVVRHLSDGSPDPGFGTNGIVRTDISGGADDAVFSVAVQPDGRIVAAGATYGDDGDFALARYLPDGSLDPSFDGDGRLTTSLGDGPWDELMDTALQPDGKIVAAGLSFSGDPCGDECFDWVVVRYKPDGSLDAGFGVGGMIRTDFGPGSDLAQAVDLQAADGKIVVAGSSRRRIPGVGVDEERLALARYLPDGSVDPQFGSGGTVITGGIGSVGGAEDIAVQPDGRIVAVGGGGGDFAVVRYDGDGNLDTSFGGDGIVTTDFRDGVDRAHAVALQRDGRIVVAGGSRGGSYDFALARYQGSACPGMSVDSIVIGTGGDDVLTGTAGNDVILGFSGDDQISGMGGADCIDGGPGADNLRGASGSDQLFGGADDDTLNGGDGADRITGGLGRDDIAGKAGDDVILVSAGDVPAGAAEIVDGGIAVASDTLRLGRDIGSMHVVGAPPAFTVVDPATGGTYSVSDVERTKDPP